MAVHKIMLDTQWVGDYTLLAIHCSEEAYKLAFLLNKQLSIHLARLPEDLDFSTKELSGTFPIYQFEDQSSFTNYFLVGNKSKVVQEVEENEGLFGAQQEEHTTALLPEFKKVDFFLKVEHEEETIPVRKMLGTINELKSVISAYEVDSLQIKSNQNLIFH